MHGEIMETVFLGNKVSAWVTAGGIAVVVYLLLVLLRVWAGRHLRRLSERTETDLDDFLIDLLQFKTRQAFLAAAALYSGSLTLEVPAKGAMALKAAFLIVLAVQLGTWGNEGINYVIRRRAARDGAEQLNLEAYSVISWIAKGAMWTFVGLVVLNNMGIQVTALVAGLGVSGIAIALAIQKILGDLFASLSIVLDRPFVIGDPIMVGDEVGIVEHVGLKTTRVRGVGGEQVILSNADLLATRIRNFRRMEERRVLLAFGLVYSTPPELLERVPDIIRDVVGTQPQARFERAHFKAFGPSSLQFEASYIVLDRDFQVYMDVQQAVNYALLRRFQAEGITFAYPTQTVLLTHAG